MLLYSVNIKDPSHLKAQYSTEDTTTATNQLQQTHRKIRGHPQLQGEHEALEEVFRQLRDLFWEDLADEGDELVVLVTQGGELEHIKRPGQHQPRRTDSSSLKEDKNGCFTLRRS